MKPTKVLPTRNYTISCTSWLGRFIAEAVPYAHVMLNETKDNYVVTAGEYDDYVVACYDDLKVSCE